MHIDVLLAFRDENQWDGLVPRVARVVVFVWLLNSSRIILSGSSLRVGVNLCGGFLRLY